MVIGFDIQSIVFVKNHQYVGGSVLKVGQVIEYIESEYLIEEVLGYERGRYLYRVKENTKGNEA